MKTKFKSKLVSILLVLATVLALIPILVLTTVATEPEITEVSTWSELLNAVNSDKTHIKLMNDIKNTVPDDELPTKHRLMFDGGKEYVLDLNGYSLEVINHANEYYTSSFPMISVSGNSSLEIKDGSLGFDNWYAGNSRKARGVVHVEDTSTLTATHVNMRNLYAGNVVSATADAKVTLDGGEYVVQNGFALYLDRQASLTLDGDIYIHTVVGDSANTQYVDGYGALYSESTGELVIHNAFFKSGIQVHSSQIGAFSTTTHELTINGKVMTEDIFVGNSTEAKNQNKEYFWYSYNQNALENVQNNSFVNTVKVISYDKKYPLEVMNGTATVNGTPVTEASYGQTVTIVANTPEAGMEFLRWDTSGVNLANDYSATTTFTMPPAPVTLAAYYGKQSVSSVSATVGDMIPGQKAYDTEITLDGGVILGTVEWYEGGFKMDENDVFKPGKTYRVDVLVYPPEDNKFADPVTAKVDGNDANVISNTAAYVIFNYTFDAIPSVGFDVVYDNGSSQLGVGGKIVLDTALMSSQSTSFKSALDAGKVTYQWYKNGEAIDGATESVYNLTAEDADGRFYVAVTADGKTNYGYIVNCSENLYQLYFNATEIIPGGKAPQLTSATPGIGLDPESMVITEMKNGNPVTEAQTLDKVLLIPGRSYRIVATLIENDVHVAYQANVHVNGVLMTEVVDGTGRIYYDFDVPAADYDVYYNANGEIGIGVTLTVDVEKMCQESPTFKHAYEAANPTYQTVFYQWYKNGEKINGATKAFYTVKSTDKNSLINCVVTLVDGKHGVGEQFAISNVITVLNVNMPYPKDGETRIKSGISADGAVVFNILWIHKDTENTMQGDHQYVEGDVYEYLVVFEVKDGFNFDYTGDTATDMTVAYIYGEKITNAGTGSGTMSYYGEVTAIHNHQYSDTVWDSDEDGHWQPCIVPGCPDPNEEWEGYMFHYGTEATCQTKGVCSVCGYEYYGEHDVAVPDYVYIDDMKCGSYCATEGCDYLSEWSYHTGGTSDCQHKAICDICHHEYGKDGDHIPKNEWISDGAYHWHECKNCDGQQLDKTACSGGTATCTEKATCSDCGEEYGTLAKHTYGTLIEAVTEKHTKTELVASVAAHYHCSACGKYFTEAKVETTLEALTGTAPSHSYGDWKNDTDKHWKECSCGKKSDEGNHVDANSNNKCDTCDKTLSGGGGVTPPPAHTHDYGTTWKTDGANHWKECSCGDKKDSAAHSGGTATCEAKAKCSVCNVEYGALAEHKYSDATCTKKATCSVCKTEKGELAAHTYVDGKCSCGATDSNYVPPHEHTFVEGKCECGETDPNYVAPHEHTFVEGKCECGETDPNYTPETDKPGTDIPGTDDPGTDKPDEPKDGLSGGAVASIVVGSVVVLGGGGFALFWFVLKKKTWADLLMVFKK